MVDQAKVCVLVPVADLPELINLFDKLHRTGQEAIRMFPAAPSIGNAIELNYKVGRLRGAMIEAATLAQYERDLQSRCPAAPAKQVIG